MVFFIVVGLTAAAILTLTILRIVTGDRGLTGWVWSSAFIGLMVLLFSLMIIGTHGETERNKSRILDSQELSVLPGTEDKFLSSAFVGGENVVSFVRIDDGKPVFDSLEDARVYETADGEPRWEEVQHYFYDGSWPWELSRRTEHVLYVPAGGITENYTVGVDSK